MNISKTKTASLNRIEKDVFYVLLVSVIILLGSYLFLLQRSVWNIFSRQQAVQEIGLLEAKAAATEAEYLEIAGREVNADHARSLGFVDVSHEQNFAIKTAKTITLSLSSNEI